MDHMKTHLSLFIILLLLTIPTGCIDLDDPLSFFDKELRRAQPYLDEILFDDDVLRNHALEICHGQSLTNKEAIITTLYRYIVEEYTYIPDPEGTELIRSPYETITLKGGDCEDLSILLMSLLENLDIKTYLVLTEDHAYALAYDVNIQSLWPYVEQALINQVEKDSGEQLKQTYENSFTLNRHQNWYYGGDGEPLAESESVDFLNISYHVTSEHPIDFYIVPSRDEFNDFSDNKDFTYITNHFYDDETEMQGTCGYLETYGGIILSNPNWKNTEVTIELTFYSHPSFYKLFENNTIRSYTIKDASCVVLEPTAGLYGYPGYDANVTGKKTAIDPITKDYFYLT